MFVAECFASCLAATPDRATFNGAATCSLRNGRPRPLGKARHRGPSMGPQHVRCGMTDKACFRHHGITPSMGPQHVRCGMKSLRRLLFLSGWLAFNGAATCSLRNGQHDKRNVRHAKVPSMGPQHVRCGMQAKGQVDLLVKDDLQWGRNMFVAECSSPAGPTRRGSRPSMGPQHVRCGMRPRQAHLNDLEGPSMGPQHVRCGMLADEFAAHLGQSALQWGRNMFVAECARLPYMDQTHCYLQWGRNMFVAEWACLTKRFIGL